MTCGVDCMANACGDGVCQVIENYYICPMDCPSPNCGDGYCSPVDGENGLNCAPDCPSIDCGDGQCQADENHILCGVDCPSPNCGDGYCSPVDGENGLNCAPDCPSIDCGDGQCQADESHILCGVDCPSPNCGDGYCSPVDGENGLNCAPDCPSIDCGDGQCQADESHILCGVDCPSQNCGDLICQPDESPSSCAIDCPLGGDIDGDGDIDTDDVALLAAAFGSIAGDARYNSAADMDNDGDVDGADLAFFYNAYAPTVGQMSPQVVNEDETLRVDIPATDPNNDVLTLSADGLPQGAVLDSQAKTLLWTPGFDQAGTYTIVLTATDPGGLTDREPVTVTVNDANRAPVISPIEDKFVGEGESISFVVERSDPDGDVLLTNIIGLEDWMSFDGTTFTAAPEYDDSGVYDVIFRVSDNQLFVEEAVKITVTGSCGDGQCQADEGFARCEMDCPSPNCGDGICSVCNGPDPAYPCDPGYVENGLTCQPDCAATCGDGQCQADEGFARCEMDCPSPNCGDGICSVCNGPDPAYPCDPGYVENGLTCQPDCAATCGDGQVRQCAGGLRGGFRAL